MYVCRSVCPLSIRPFVLLAASISIKSMTSNHLGEKGSHGRRCSQRLLEKRKRATHNSKRHLSSESPLLAADSPDKLITRARSHPPPAPPPPPMPEFTKLPANTNEVSSTEPATVSCWNGNTCVLTQEAVRTPLSPRNSPNLSLARKPLRKRANKGQRLHI